MNDATTPNALGDHLGDTRTERLDGAGGTGDLREVIVCSLEPWDDVWRRNQFFADILLRRNPALRILFVEPAADVLFDLASRRLPTSPRWRKRSLDGRLRAFRPLKPLPRKIGRIADTILLSQVRLAARVARFSQPILWINDVTFVPLGESAGWPMLYDVTDDWLLAPFSEREHGRLQHLDSLALEKADEVVVCSPALAASRGARRQVSLIPNGVDIEHFRRPRPRPADLPKPPVAVYVGSLHDARIDVELVLEVARSLPQLNLAFLGPNSLEPDSQRLLDAMPNIVMLGPRPYSEVPGYLQHADVVIVPHLVTPFTESLDPIKARECLAVDTPTVATPVAGFRDYATALTIADRAQFAARVKDAISKAAPPGHRVATASWEEQAAEFEAVLKRARTG
jgi:teichuronic acid biosynthesis glycosyltransferase TuaH